MLSLFAIQKNPGVRLGQLSKEKKMALVALASSYSVFRQYSFSVQFLLIGFHILAQMERRCFQFLLVLKTFYDSIT